MASQASNLCAVCNAATTKHCVQCKSAQYCSVDCQKADLPTHKLLCATFADFNSSIRPSNEHYKAIHFPEHGDKIEVIWLYDPDQFWRDDQATSIASLLGPESTPSFIRVYRNELMERNLTDTLFIACRDEGGSEINGSVRKICATKPGWSYFGWQGPLIAYAKRGVSSDPVDCRDFNMNDFRHIADYFLWYQRKRAVAGVRINCVGDQKMFNKPVFEKVELSPNSPIFDKHDTSDIAARVGLPLCTRKIHPDSKWAEDKRAHPDPYGNPRVAYLHICLDPKADIEPTGQLGWGMASLQWQNKVGSIMVVRQDKKPLTPFDIEALCKYCQEEVYPLFEHNTGEFAEDEPLSNEDLLTMICQPAFAIKWRNWQDEKPRGSEDAKAPYPWGL